MLERSNVPLIKTVTFITRVNEFTTKEMLIRVVKETYCSEDVMIVAMNAMERYENYRSDHEEEVLS